MKKIQKVQVFLKIKLFVADCTTSLFQITYQISYYVLCFFVMMYCLWVCH